MRKILLCPEMNHGNYEGEGIGAQMPTRHEAGHERSGAGEASLEEMGG